jgi:excisionase family DNA binding protein
MDLTLMDFIFLTAKEVAELLRISRRTVYNWIDEGIIRAVKINDIDKSAVRIPLSEVERILKEVFEDDKKVESILKEVFEDDRVKEVLGDLIYMRINKIL